MSGEATGHEPDPGDAVRPSLDDLTAEVVAFREARAWRQFHTPKDTAVSLALEAAEVLELMQWRNGDELARHLETNREALGHELSDVLYWVLLIAHDHGIDLGRAFRDKMRLNDRKYPVDGARGSHRKYTELEARDPASHPAEGRERG